MCCNQGLLISSQKLRHSPQDTWDHLEIQCLERPHNDAEAILQKFSLLQVLKKFYQKCTLFYWNSKKKKLLFSCKICYFQVFQQIYRLEKDFNPSTIYLLMDWNLFQVYIFAEKLENNKFYSKYIDLKKISIHQQYNFTFSLQ